MMTFQEYKDKVSIIQILEDLGYQQDKKKGKISPVFVKISNGQKVDEVVIRNPNNSSIQTYFDRNYNKGDLIGFIRNNLSEFSQFSHSNEFVHINKVLSHYANIPYVPKYETYSKETQQQEFNSARYLNSKPTVNDLHFLNRERKLNPGTIETFLPFISLIQDSQSKYNFKNIGFPYHNPTDKKPKVTNYEMRNYNFKGMAVGGDRSNSMWLANFSGDKQLVKSIFIAESAIDAMSFYQLYKSRINLSESCFCSVGGHITNNQIKNIVNSFPNAKKHTCFDNDIAGNLYDIRFFSTLKGDDLKVIMKKEDESVIFKIENQNKEFNILKSELNLDKFKQLSDTKENLIRVHKPIAPYKDFNEVLQKTIKQSIKWK